MAIADVDQTAVLKSVERFYKQRLRLPDRSIYFAVEPLNPPVAEPGGDFWIAMGLDDGDFPFDEQDDEQLREDFRLKVFGFSRIQLDQANRDHQFLFDKRRGALAIKRKLLLIVGEQLTLPDGTPISASRVEVRRSVKPTYDPSQNVGWAGVVLGIDFDWSLDEAEDFGDD